jgi:hypothetical protein
VGGQDATEAFEDVGHSDEAREILEGLKVAKLKREVRLLQLNISLTLTLALPSCTGHNISVRKKKNHPTTPTSSTSSTNSTNPFLPQAHPTSPLTNPQQEGDPAPKTGSTSYIAAGPKDSSSSSSTTTTSLGIGLYAIILLGGAFAFAAYRYLQVNDKQ